MDAKKISSELKENLTITLPNAINRIILFKSIARGKSNDKSDIDILIIFNTPVDLKIKNLVFDTCSRLNIKYSVWINTTLMSLAELNSIQGKQPFIQNALRDGIVIS